MMVRYAWSHPIEPHTHTREILSVEHYSGNVVLYDDQRVILGATVDGLTPCAPRHGALAAFIADADPVDTRPAILRFETVPTGFGHAIYDLRPGGPE